MRQLTFNETSWHYRLAKFGGLELGYYNRTTDICTYMRKCMLGIMFGLLAFIAILLVSTLTIHFLVGLAFSLWAGVWLMSSLGEIGMVIYCAVAVVTVVIFICASLGEWRQHRRMKMMNEEPRPDGFIREAYKSWKGKYCLPITIVDPNAEPEEEVEPNDATDIISNTDESQSKS